MATYLFSTLTNNQVLTFDPAVDTLSIDIAGLNAASGAFAQSGADLRLTYKGKTIQLAGMTLTKLSSGHVTFANGSTLLVGDDTADTVNDGLANSLTGTAWGDYLDGRGGADTLAGGDGNDLYVVDNAGDQVVETNAAAAQIDTVWSILANYTLPANVENLRLMGTGNINGTGNAFNNVLYANAGNNTLDGGAGIDTVSYQYAAASVTASLSITAAQATGGSGSDTLLGIENLTGSGFDDRLTGNASGNTLLGGLGNDVLDGRSGADSLAGGDGNDLYAVDNAGDQVVETNADTAQKDAVQSTLANYTLPANVENLRLMGAGNLNGTGNGLGNVLYANAGNNVLDGGAGIDTVSYQYAAAGVTARLNTTAAQATGGSGSDTLLGIENLTGSAFDDRFTGNASGNILNGGAGNDVLDGLGGADTLSGGDGNDTLSGSDLGFKNLDGGAGTDTLILAGAGQTLDLTAFGSKLHGLEAIDLNGANTLNLTAAALRNLSTTSDKLVVDGNASGVVNAGGGWTAGADATANGQTYHTYTQGTATLWVDTDVALNINGALSLAKLNGMNGFWLDGAGGGGNSSRAITR